MESEQIESKTHDPGFIKEFREAFGKELDQLAGDSAKEFDRVKTDLDLAQANLESQYYGAKVRVGQKLSRGDKKVYDLFLRVGQDLGLSPEETDVLSENFFE